MGLFRRGIPKDDFISADDENNSIWGVEQGLPYAAAVAWLEEEGLAQMQLRFFAKAPESGFDPERAETFELWDVHFDSFKVNAYTTVAVLSLPYEGEWFELPDRISQIASLLRDWGFVPCCASCGREDDFCFCETEDLGPEVLCGDCVRATRRAVWQDDKSYRSPRRGRAALGIAGCAALLLGVMFVVPKMVIPVVLAAFFISILCMEITLSCARRFTKGMNIAAAAVFLCAAILGLGLSFSRTIARGNREDAQEARRILSAAEGEVTAQDKAWAETVLEHTTAMSVFLHPGDILPHSTTRRFWRLAILTILAQVCGMLLDTAANSANFHGGRRGTVRRMRI